MIPSIPAPCSVRAHAVAILIALLAAAHPAGAQFQQHVVNDDFTGEENRFDPAAVALDDGGFLLLWVDNGRAQQDILARRFDATLRPVAPPVRINDDEGIREQRGVVSSPARGGRAVAAWIDERGSALGVYAQVLRTDTGEAVGPNRQLTTDLSVGLRAAPAAATSSNGTSLVCWEEGTYGLRRVQARLLSAEGAPAGPPIEIAPESPEDVVQEHPAVAALPDQRWLAAWHESDGSTFELRFRLLAADGTPLGTSSTLAHSEPLVTALQGPEPTLAVRPQDVLLAWVDNLGGNGDVYGRRLDLNGNLLTSRTLLRAASDRARDNQPRLSGASDGRCALTWFGGAIDRTYPHVRFFGADGQPVTADLTLTDQDIGVVSRPGCALPLPGNEWLLVWSDDRPLSLQVYFRKVGADGSAAGPTASAWGVPASSSQILPDIAMFPDGRSVVAWGDLRNGTFNVFARYLRADGVPEGQSFQVNTLPVLRRYSGSTDISTYWAYRPAVAASAAGGFVVTWAAAPEGGTRSLYGRLFDSGGQPVGDDFPVTNVTGDRQGQSDPKPAMAANGSFVIALHEDRGDAARDEVRIQRFGPTGTPIGRPTSVVDIAGSPFTQLVPAIALSPFGDMVVVWMDNRRSTSSNNWDIFRSRLNQQGELIEEENPLVNPEDTAGSDQYNPAVATNGAAIVTVWEDRPLTAGLIQGRLDILETRVQRGGQNGGGNPSSAPAAIVNFTVNASDHPGGIKNPRVAIDGSGRFVVTWWDERNGQRRVWGRRYDAEGEPIGEPYSIVGGETRDIRTLTAVAADNAGIQYVWNDSRRGRGWDVYSRRVSWEYSGETTPILLEHWETASLPEGLRIRWDLPGGTSGALFRSWRDPAAGPQDRSPTPDAVLVSPEWIGASSEGQVEIVDHTPWPGQPVHYFLEMQVHGSGSEFLGPVEAIWDPPPVAWRIGPNPAWGAVGFRPPVSGAAQVRIFDPAGRQLRTVERSGGPEALIWDGRDSAGREVPSGVYLARVSMERGPSATLRLVRVR